MKPQFSMRALPYIVIDPVPAVDASSAVLLIPPKRILIFRRTLFALASPQLVSLSVTVQATVQPDRSVRLTGGTVILTVGVYANLDAAGVEKQRVLITLNHDGWAFLLRAQLSTTSSSKPFPESFSILNHLVEYEV
jgi:hypothetical protein